MTVRVDGVVVIPMQDGYAYAHADDGRCLLISGPREQMIDLCRRVKAFNLEGGAAIYVNLEEFPEHTFLSAGECPVHEHRAA